MTLSNFNLNILKMTINKSPLTRRRFKTTYSSRINNKARKLLNSKWRSIYLNILMYWLLSFIILTIATLVVIYFKYIVWLPSIQELENIQIAESSIIYDKDWAELYKIFKEKRTYVPFENINKNMINAIVAIEDKRYWSNPWVDIIWLIRAWLNYILWKADWVKGTSTLTQQLIRNTIITNEVSIERKVKEIYLAYKLTSTVSKEKILELYLNKISYWNNAFGIEEWARTYFNKSSKDIWILESSILASLPKWPTYYSPYNHQDRLMGFPYIYASWNSETVINIINQKDKEINNEILKHLINFISDLKASRLEWTEKTLICNLKKENFKTSIKIDNDWCSVFAYSELIDMLNNIKIKVDNNYIEYETWRKDRVLWRMLEDKYITFDEYKKSIIDAIWYTFYQPKEKIKAPHFVFYVKEYLEEKFWKEIVSVWWLKIYTTLDWKLQEKAEELLTKQVNKNAKKFNATNAALISIDNKTWWIIAMVWWKDYFDSENKWNVNIITSTLQPWSSFKPFVYSLAMFKKAIWTKTPIFDLQTNFPSGYTPKNFDWRFMWKMNISTALNNSRNIPAIKMFFLAWWEKSILEFMRKLWVKSLKDDWNYGAPLALWTGEMTPLELATAYSVFANLWVKKDVTPILKIVDSKGNIIEENKLKVKDVQAISKEQAYITNTILSDTSSRPSSWNNYVSLKGRTVAAKTGTSTKQYTKNWKKYIFPNSLWTIWYTPQITTVVWAWNTDWSETNMSWDWLNAAWPIWRDFMEYAHKWKTVENWIRPSWIKEINISEISWLLPNPEVWNSSFIIKSLFINPPTEYDNSYKQVEVDTLCNWKVTENTPEDAIKKVTVVEIKSLEPKNPNWQWPITKWAQSDAFKERYWIESDLVTMVSDKECVRNWTNSDISIKTTINENDILIAWENYIEFTYKSINPITKIEILIDDVIVDELNIENKIDWIYSWKIFIPVSKVWTNSILKLRAIDNQYLSNTVSRNISISKKDSVIPQIDVTNPLDWNIKLYSDTYFNLKANIIENSWIKSINILIDWIVVKWWLTDRILSYPVNSEKNITSWKHIITIEVIDNSWNKSTKDIQLEILVR